MAAATIAATSRPETPTGSLCTMNHGNTASDLASTLSGTVPGFAYTYIHSIVPMSTKNTVFTRYRNALDISDRFAAVSDFAAT